jgi:hypothetical protein
MSFIAFQILDVDASDFASPFRTASATASTDPPEDLRRAPLPATPVPLVALPPDAYAETLRVVHRVEAVRLSALPHPSLRHSSRTTLARGLLADLLTA